MRYALVALAFLLSPALLAQPGAGILITEIGNNGSKKALYTGGDYVELLVTAEEGVKLAGWHLTDLSSPSGTAKDNEGSVRFSDREGSVFLRTIPGGTFILVCLGGRGDFYGAAVQEEDVALDDGNDRIVVFADASSGHMERGEGTVQFTGKDNLAVISAWEKTAAVAVVTWGGSSSWTGTTPVQLAQESLENGKIAFMTADPVAWESTDSADRATPGRKNPAPDRE
jgi:hypothetical protein